MQRRGRSLQYTHPHVYQQSSSIHHLLPFHQSDRDNLHHHQRVRCRQSVKTWAICRKIPTLHRLSFDLCVWGFFAARRTNCTTQRSPQLSWTSCRPQTGGIFISFSIYCDIQQFHPILHFISLHILRWSHRGEGLGFDNASSGWFLRKCEMWKLFHLFQYVDSHCVEVSLVQNVLF